MSDIHDWSAASLKSHRTIKSPIKSLRPETVDSRSVQIVPWQKSFSGLHRLIFQSVLNAEIKIKSEQKI